MERTQTKEERIARTAQRSVKDCFISDVATATKLYKEAKKAALEMFSEEETAEALALAGLYYAGKQAGKAEARAKARSATR